MQIEDGHPDVRCSCRLLLKEGAVRGTGQYPKPSCERAIRIGYRAAATIDRSEPAALACAGNVGSTAALDG